MVLTSKAEGTRSGIGTEGGIVSENDLQSLTTQNRLADILIDLQEIRASLVTAQAHNAALAAERDTLTAEVERLKAVLERIARYDMGHDDPFADSVMRQWAKEALEADGSTGGAQRLDREP